VGRYAATIFLSAFLLFQVQPLAGKTILPWFGGGSTVWTTCMLFFQSALLVGYAYAHLLASRFSPRSGAGLHLLLLGASLLLLPITPAESWKPADAAVPAWRILALLTASLGAPFVLAASTGPLLQRWFSWEHPGRSPYRLYALSNLGSLLGLLAYPFLVEPLVGLRLQALLWSAGYAGFVALAGWCALALRRGPPMGEDVAGDEADVASVGGQPGLTAGGRLLWLALPACASLLLLATTSRMTQDVAPIPFLWVLPLSLYLLSFVICFDSERWYDRRFWAPVFLVGLAALFLVVFREGQLHIVPQLAVLSIALFGCCMVCHGELVRLRPPPRHLTGFYLSVSAGGAAGGLLAAVVAPSLFDDFLEFEIALGAAYALFAASLLREAGARGRWRRSGWLLAGLVIGGCSLTAALAVQLRDERGRALVSARNFYGVLKVYEEGEGTRAWRRTLWHGTQPHGAQLLAGAQRSRPTTWFGPESGIATAIERFPPREGASGREPGDGLEIGVVGLGVGTIAAYARPGDRIRFYEIDPQVDEISDRYFSYRRDSPARVEVVLGDARISLERELAEDGPQGFDILVLDAFSSDAAPIHLLTREAFELYWRHLKPDGILAVHITAVHLDLSPVVRGMARLFDKESVRIIDRPEGGSLVTWSYWVLVTSNREFLSDPRVRTRTRVWSAAPHPPRGEAEIVWTDDYSDLLRVVK
jgi:hypothetical protein